MDDCHLLGADQACKPLCVPPDPEWIPAGQRQSDVATACALDDWNEAAARAGDQRSPPGIGNRLGHLDRAALNPAGHQRWQHLKHRNVASHRSHPYIYTGLQTGGISPMRTPLYDVNARRKTVSITLNADLAAKASALGINISRTAEAALVKAFEAAEVAKIREEIREATRITDDLVARHGLPFPEFGLFDPDSASDDAA